MKKKVVQAGLRYINIAIELYFAGQFLLIKPFYATYKNFTKDES